MSDYNIVIAVILIKFLRETRKDHKTITFNIFLTILTIDRHNKVFWLIGKCK